MMHINIGKEQAGNENEPNDLCEVEIIIKIKGTAELFAQILDCD